MVLISFLQVCVDNDIKAAVKVHFSSTVFPMIVMNSLRTRLLQNLNFYVKVARGTGFFHDVNDGGDLVLFCTEHIWCSKCDSKKNKH